MSEHPNPALKPPDSKLKMHLRLLRAGGQTYRLVTLRPGTKIGFSTNYFHDTWHIVSGQRGARLLARLLWGLSYQRQPGTLVLVHGEHLLPTPFEGERSDPFLLAPAGLVRLDASALRALKDRVNRLGPPDRTIRWHTFGLDVALRADLGSEPASSSLQAERDRLRWDKSERVWRQERMERLGGFIVYSAPPAILRQQALIVHSLRVQQGSRIDEMDYHFLSRKSNSHSWPDGEVQIFADYPDRVAAAVEARRELVPQPNQPITSVAMQVAVSRRRDQIKARRAQGRRRHRA